MALQILNGNLWDLVPEECIIVHGCNAQGVMGSGFAFQVKQLCPDAYEEYIQFCEGFTPEQLLGCFCSGYEKGWTIVNAITQLNYGRDTSVCYVDYVAVKEILDRVAHLSNAYGLPVYLPFIGGGLANGDRVKLLDIFKDCFKDTEAYLVI